LRSPLSAIQMRLQVLKRQYQQDAQLPQALQLIQHDVNRGAQVLENLLLLARLDPEKAEQLPKQPVNLKMMVQEVLQALQPFAAEQQIEWQLSIGDSQMIANSELIFSCLGNLRDSANRYILEQSKIETKADVDATRDRRLLIENSGAG